MLIDNDMVLQGNKLLKRFWMLKEQAVHRNTSIFPFQKVICFMTKMEQEMFLFRFCDLVMIRALQDITLTTLDSK